MEKLFTCDMCGAQKTTKSDKPRLNPVQKAIEGLTNKVVARKVGVSITTVAMWRIGSIIPHRFMLPVIQKACKELKSAQLA